MKHRVWGALLFPLLLVGCSLHGNPTQNIAAAPPPPAPAPAPPPAPEPKAEPLSIPQTQAQLPRPQPINPEALASPQPPEAPPPEPQPANPRPQRKQFGPPAGPPKAPEPVTPAAQQQAQPATQPTTPAVQPVPAAVQPAPVAAQPTPVVVDTGTRSQIQEIVPTSELKRLQESLAARTAEIRKVLEQAQARGASKEQGSVISRIQSFLQQSDDAEKRGDLRQADALAERAQVLARELQSANH